jgi:transcriptional regulator with XRE-family HTH domain
VNRDTDMNGRMATNIRELRHQRAWTQEQLAAAAQLNTRTVQRIEEGRGGRAETVQAIAGALDASVESLRAEHTTTAAGATLGVAPLRWTVEQPTLPGTYWVRGGTFDTPHRTTVFLSGGALMTHAPHAHAPEYDLGAWSMRSLPEGYQWYGPVRDDKAVEANGRSVSCC